MNKSTSYVISVATTWGLEREIEAQAKKEGTNKSQWIRDVILERLYAIDPTVAKRLAVDCLKRAAMAVVFIATLFGRAPFTMIAVVFIPFASTQPGFEARRPRVQTVAFRANRSPGRRQQREVRPFSFGEVA